MRKRCLIWLFLSGSSAVLADAPPAAPAEVQYRFDDDLVLGEEHLPGEHLVPARRRGQRASLIEVKSSLVTELLKSAEDL